MHQQPAEVIRYDRPGDRGWGHDFTFIPTNPDGTTGRVVGWLSPRPERGDVLVLPGPNGGGSPYVVDEVRWSVDPMDMFSADVTYHRDAVKADGTTELKRPRRSFAQIVKDRQAVEQGQAKEAWKQERDIALGRLEP